MTQPENPPAFPMPASEHSQGGHFEQPGMTLRDYFAAHVVMPTDIGTELAEYLAGRPNPYDASNRFDAPHPYVEISKFWVEVEAAYRYRIADAMLAEREKDGAK